MRSFIASCCHKQAVLWEIWFVLTKLSFFSIGFMKKMAVCHKGNYANLKLAGPATSWYFRGRQNYCDLYLTTKPVFKNFGGSNCPVFSPGCGYIIATFISSCVLTWDFLTFSLQSEIFLVWFFLEVRARESGLVLILLVQAFQFQKGPAVIIDKVS